MRILFISSDNNKTSGAFLCLVELNKLLNVQYGIDTLVVLPKPGDGVELLKKYQIKYCYVRSFSWITFKGCTINAITKTFFKSILTLYNMISIFRICNIIRTQNIDIVHTNTVFSYVGAVAAFLEDKPHVWHIRESIDKGFKSKILNENFGYNLIGHSDSVIAVSKLVKKEYQKRIKQKNISIIYDGVSKKFYQKREIFQCDTITFTCIGGLSRNKNQIELIEAFYLLFKRGKRNYRLNIVGRGEMELYLKRKVKEYSLEKNIHFCGVYDDVRLILNKTDVLCSASKSEAFGRTIVEGMLHGCLLLVAQSENNTALELLHDRQSGILYTSGNVKQLADAIEEIMDEDNKEKFKSIALKGQGEAVEKFLTTINAEKIVDVYKHIETKKDN